jgi:hypothetical protein
MFQLIITILLFIGNEKLKILSLLGYVLMYLYVFFFLTLSYRNYGSPIRVMCWSQQRPQSDRNQKYQLYRRPKSQRHSTITYEVCKYKFQFSYPLRHDLIYFIDLT